MLQASAVAILMSVPASGGPVPSRSQRDTIAGVTPRASAKSFERLYFGFRNSRKLPPKLLVRLQKIAPESMICNFTNLATV